MGVHASTPSVKDLVCDYMRYEGGGNGASVATMQPKDQTTSREYMASIRAVRGNTLFGPTIIQ